MQIAGSLLFAGIGRLKLKRIDTAVYKIYFNSVLLYAL